MSKQGPNPRHLEPYRLTLAAHRAIWKTLHPNLPIPLVLPRTLYGRRVEIVPEARSER